MAQVSAETAAMISASNMFEDTRNQIQQISNTAWSAIEGTAASYVTSGGTAFRAVMAEWNADMTKITNALEDMVQKLRQSASNYHHAMAVDSTSVNSVLAALHNGTGTLL